VASGEQGLVSEITKFQVLDNSLNGIDSGTCHFSEVYIISIEVVLVLDNFDQPLGCEIGEPHLGLKQPRASSGALG
jgi:hypothetical protein